MHSDEERWRRLSGSSDAETARGIAPVSVDVFEDAKKQAALIGMGPVTCPPSLQHDNGAATSVERARKVGRQE